MSKQRAKGTRRENGWLPLLRRVWPHIQRIGNTKGPNDRGDYINTGDWIVESKHAAEFAIPAWVRQTAAKADPELLPWIIFARTDKRKFPWDIAFMPAELAVILLESVKEKLDAIRQV